MTSFVAFAYGGIVATYAQQFPPSVVRYTRPTPTTAMPVVAVKKSTIENKAGSGVASATKPVTPETVFLSVEVPVTALLVSS